MKSVTFLAYEFLYYIYVLGRTGCGIMDLKGIGKALPVSGNGPVSGCC